MFNTNLAALLHLLHKWLLFLSSWDAELIATTHQPITKLKISLLSLHFYPFITSLWIFLFSNSSPYVSQYMFLNLSLTTTYFFLPLSLLPFLPTFLPVPFFLSFFFPSFPSSSLYSFLSFSPFEIWKIQNFQRLQ